MVCCYFVSTGILFFFSFCFCGYRYCLQLKLHLDNLMLLIMYVISGYISTLRNNIRSRAWGAAIGCSYRVERCCIVKVVSEPLQSLLLFFAIFSPWNYVIHCSFIHFKCHIIYFIIFHNSQQIISFYYSFWYLLFLERSYRVLLECFSSGFITC